MAGNNAGVGLASYGITAPHGVDLSGGQPSQLPFGSGAASGSGLGSYGISAPHGVDLSQSVPPSPFGAANTSVSSSTLPAVLAQYNANPQHPQFASGRFGTYPSIPLTPNPITNNVQTPGQNAGEGYSLTNHLISGLHPLASAWNWLGKTGQGIGGGIYDLLNGHNVMQDILGIAPDGTRVGPGITNPDQAAQFGAQQHAVFNQQVNNDSTLSGFGKFAVKAGTGFGADLMSDPQTWGMSVVPVGRILNATGVTPATKFLFDLMRGAVKGSPATNTAASESGASAVRSLLALPAPKESAPFIQSATNAVRQTLPNPLQRALGAPNISGLLPRFAQAAKESDALAAQRAAREAEAANINKWAGLDNGYQGIKKTLPDALTNHYFQNMNSHELQAVRNEFMSTMGDLKQSVSPQNLKETARGLRDTQQSKNNVEFLKMIRQLGGIKMKPGMDVFTDYKESVPTGVKISVGNNNGLPLDEVASAMGTDTNNLLSMLGNSRITPKLPLKNFLDAAKDHVGYNDAISGMQELGHHVNAVDQAIAEHANPYVTETPNFTMKFPLALRDNTQGLVPVGNVISKLMEYAGNKITPEEAARLAGQNPIGKAYSNGDNGLRTLADTIKRVTNEQRASKLAANAALNAGTNIGKQAAEKAPYAAFPWQSTVGKPAADFLKDVAPNGVPLVRGPLNFITDNAGRMFKKYYGATPALVKQLTGAESSKHADALIAQHTFSDLARKYAFNPEQMNEFRQAIEGQASSNSKVTAAVNEWRNSIDNFKGGGGRNLGTHAELQAKNLAGEPILPNVRDNYYPLRFNEQPAHEVEKIMQQQPNYGKFSTSGPFAKERLFKNSDQALAAGLKPELSPFKAGYQRILESSGALRNADLLNQIVDSGIAKTESAPGYVKSELPGLKGYYLKEADSNAIRSFIEPSQVKGKAGTILGAYDRGLETWKRLFTYNPLFHLHNILTNGVYLGGANVPNALHTLVNLAKGQPDEWYNRALAAGAFSADKGNVLRRGLESIDNATTSPGVSVGQKFANAGRYVKNDALWDIDKALRTDIFKHGVQNGLSDAEAAAKANHFLIDYNNLTPFEQNVLARAIPFYRWKKGNLPLQMEQLLNNPAKPVMYYTAKNAISQALSGQNTDQTGRINTGKQFPDGSNSMLDVNTPMDDIPKLAAGGLGAYAFSSMSPILKEAILQATNEKYTPGGIFTPGNRPGMADRPIHMQGTPGALQDRLAHAVQSLIPLVNSGMGRAAGASQALNNALNQAQRTTAPATSLEWMAPLMGMYTSRDNPSVDQYYQDKNQQQLYQNQIKYDESHNIQVPPILKHLAYQKLSNPFKSAAAGGH